MQHMERVAREACLPACPSLKMLQRYIIFGEANLGTFSLALKDTQKCNLLSPICRNR